jgi:hypothetical protein
VAESGAVHHVTRDSRVGTASSCYIVRGTPDLGCRQPERNDQSYEPYRANGNAPHSSNQWGERQHANIQPTPPMFNQRAGGLTPDAIDIVREEIAGVFRDKLRVSMVPRGQSYRKPYDNRFDHHPYPQGTRIPEFAKFSGDQEKTRANT